MLQATRDKNDIAEVHGRIGTLIGDIGLAGIATVKGKVDDLKGLLVTCLLNNPRYHHQTHSPAL